jgi:hypothetical protein
MKSTIDDVLKASFIADKLIGVGEMMWLKTHKAVCELVMEKDDLGNILSCAGNFKSVKPEITRLYRNSKLGERVLHFATSLVGSSDIGDIITEALANVSSSLFTMESVGRYMTKTDSELMKYKGDLSKVLRVERSVSFESLGRTAVLSVVPRQECDFRLACELRAAALGCVDGIPTYMHEQFSYVGVVGRAPANPKVVDREGNTQSHWIFPSPQ